MLKLIITISCLMALSSAANKDAQAACSGKAEDAECTFTYSGGSKAGQGFTGKCSGACLLLY